MVGAKQPSVVETGCASFGVGNQMSRFEDIEHIDSADDALVHLPVEQKGAELLLTRALTNKTEGVGCRDIVVISDHPRPRR